MSYGNFEFEGTGGQYFLLSILLFLMVVLTLGLYTPWAVVEMQKWKAKNTFIANRQLIFTGTGGALFGTYIIVFLLSWITVGLYLPWGYCRIQRWITNNTHFAEIGDASYRMRLG